MQIALGTAQFGLDYGVTNARGKCSRNDVEKIIDLAARSNVMVLDTAPAYGDSERILGNAIGPNGTFRLVTKFSRPGAASKSGPLDSLKASLQRLRRERVYALLAHHVEVLLGPDAGTIWRGMEQAKSEGLAEKIGASVYTGAEIDELLVHARPDIVQVPFSVADQRLHESGHLAKLKDAGVEIHARSVFLQGLLVVGSKALPTKFRGLSSYAEMLECKFRELGLTLLEGSLLAVAQRPEIDYAIIGVSSFDEFRCVLSAAENLESRHSAALADLRLCDEKLLDPSRW